ncbi:MAG TPA: TonB-dependent receptor plug domain-containing protein, partial [Candidatus Sphingobacterium stercoripullorum]|nr:TonB-dependent receptor plug domain-containing protein [Candidatus Sphingobacterium stercoripullorum]
MMLFLRYLILLGVFPFLISHAMAINNYHTGNIVQEIIQVKGKVVTASGEAIPNATIIYGDKEASANNQGEFNISFPRATTIIVSAIGYETKQVFIDRSQEINVDLDVQDVDLDEVVVVGYAVQKKSNVSGSVSSVDGSVLNQRPVPNATNLLQGRVTGLQVTQPSGEPGRDDPNLLIRGRGSFGGSTSPLVLIDGVSGSLSAISPDDIENVTVLKDASSAAIYGARAANGVILVTTKSGSKGQTSINYRVNVGKHNPTSLPDFISNSAEYMKMYNQAAERSGISFRYPLADIEKYENSNGDPQYPSFDNLSYYIKPANVQQHNLSVNGGGEKNTYNISAGYLNQDGLIKG